jgi:hypothetical protein
VAVGMAGLEYLNTYLRIECSSKCEGSEEEIK